MTARRRLLKDGGILTGGQVIGQAMVFVRTVILAHLLTKADFGIAAIFQTTVFLFDMISDLNVGTMLIQDKDGDNFKLQASAHTIAGIRSAILAAAMAALAWPTAFLFEVPNAVLPFACLALVPLLRGATHTDLSRLQRHMRYAPATVANAVAQTVATSVAWPLALLLHNYTVMLWLLVIQGIVALIMSHVMAERPYRWGWDPICVRKMFSFGWPLLVNGLLMFGIFQGDRVVLGAQRLFPSYTKDDLGLYSVAFSLALAPTLLFSNVATSLLLPRLSKVQTMRDAFRDRAMVVMELFAISGGALAVMLIIGGGAIISVVYGTKYVAAGAFIGWLGAAQGVRMIRVGTTLVALAKGDTRNSMKSNIARSLGIVALVVAAAFGVSLAGIAACGFWGEVVALGASIWGLWRCHALDLGLFLKPLIWAFAAMALCAVASGTMQAATLGALWLISFAMAWALAYALGVALLSPSLRQELRSMATAKRLIAQ